MRLFDRFKKKYNTNDPEAVEIRKKIEKLISMNDMIEINDVIPIEEVRQFEAENGIRLPDDYVWFITNVGNGGKWYDGVYEFYPLNRTGISYEGLPDYERGEPDYSLDVLSKGCTYFLGIILKGEHFGEISSNGEGLAYLPEKEPYFHGFKELYLKWLDEACLGYDVMGFNTRPYGTIEEHLEQYKTDHDIKLLNSIFSKVNKKCASKQFLSEVFEVFKAEEVNENKVRLAVILIKAGYEDSFSVLNEIFTPENYEDIVWELYSPLKYFEKPLDADGVTEDAPGYYPMLVSIMRYYETAKERKYFKYCFDMTVMNPLFKAEDIIGFLTSDDMEIVKYLAISVYKDTIISRVKKYIDEAKVKYENRGN